MTKRELMMIDTLAEKMESIETMSQDALDKCRAVLRTAPNEALTAIINHKVKFLNLIAVSELHERGLI